MHSSDISVTRTADRPAAWQRVAQSRIWLLLLLSIGTLGSVVYPHPPLVALGAIAATTLKPSRAFGVAIVFWLSNQLCGYGWRGYPLSAESLSWAAVMGIGMLLVVGLVAVGRWRWQPTTRQNDWLYLSAALVSGFVLFEGLILSLGFLLTGSHVLTGTVLGWLFFKEAIWAIGLGLLHGGLMQRAFRAARI
ncbi:hypothetical protein IFO70_11350 [Phormidium tenue FACHB-886]|nr:hypothetical protein [Phormidium tenue FACHB-886]